MERIKGYDAWKLSSPPDVVPEQVCEFCQEPSGEIIEFYGEYLCPDCFQNETDICGQCHERDWQDHIRWGICRDCEDWNQKEKNKRN